MTNFVLETKLRELDLLIDEVIINVNNKYKSLKNNIVDTNYKLLYNLYYTNTLESNKRIYTQRKMLIDVKMLDLYFYKLYKYNEISYSKYKNISRRYITVTKLIYGWIKSEDKSK